MLAATLASMSAADLAEKLKAEMNDALAEAAGNNTNGYDFN